MFGLICVKAYNFWWGYTAAQIDLMIADAPTVVYNNKGKEKKHTRKEMEKLTQMWKQKHNKTDEDMNIGKTKMSFDDFVKHGIKQ